MKYKIFVFLFVFRLCSEVSLEKIKHTHSLVLVQEPTRSINGHLHLKLCPLDSLTAVTDHQIAFNKLPEASKALDIEHVNMMKEGVEVILEPCSLEEVPVIRSKKSACGFKIKDANGATYVFVFKGSDGEKYQAWIVPNSLLDIFIGQMSDEVKEMGDIIEKEVVELPNIPLPACIARVLVKVGTAVLVVYFTIKEKLQECYADAYQKYLTLRPQEKDERKA